MLLTALAENQLTASPGHSSKPVQQYSPKSIAMAKGHFNQQCKNAHSTTTKQRRLQLPAIT